jgi:hypothetical protein
MFIDGLMGSPAGLDVGNCRVWPGSLHIARGHIHAGLSMVAGPVAKSLETAGLA